MYRKLPINSAKDNITVGRTRVRIPIPFPAGEAEALLAHTLGISIVLTKRRVYITLLGALKSRILWPPCGKISVLLQRLHHHIRPILADASRLRPGPPQINLGRSIPLLSIVFPHRITQFIT